MMKILKKIKIYDIFGFLYFIILIIPSCFYKIYLKITKNELWLVAENGKMARDNGYVFYKYLIENHKEIKTYFAIDKKCSDYEKVKNLGNIIQWGSFKHYFIYMSATKNISSHKNGNPNELLFTVLHIYLNLYNNRVFLQHGVLYQNFEMFHKKNCKFKYFICGAKKEFDFIKEKYGYNENEVKYTGLARFDNLHDIKVNNQIILYIPTWRRWLNSKEKFSSSEYYKRIYSFINNKDLEKLLEKTDKYLYFYPHMASQQYINLYKTNNKRVKILDAKKVDIQDLLKKASLMITDYSSVFTDFAYMNKPIIYYQYDKKDYMEKHIGKNCYDTYFDFEKDGFGSVVNKEDSVLKIMNEIIKENFSLKKKYKEKINNFFILHDNKNCERIYNEIKNRE